MEAKGPEEKKASRRAEQIARAKEKREAVLKQIRKEKRVMLCSSLFAAVGAILWIIATSLDYWYIVEGGVSNSTGPVTRSTGLWRTCIKTVKSEEEDWCKYHTLFPSRDDIKRNPGLDIHLIDYQRTSILFALFSLLLMLMSLVSAFYTFKNARFIYKRLAAGLYFVTAFCVLIVLEVVVTWVSYEKLNVPFHHPPNSSTTYGFSFYIGWVVFLIYVVNSALFLIYSRKRKQHHEENNT